MPSTLAISLELQPSAVPPSVRITVTETGSPSVGSVTVVRTDPDGRTRPVRTPDGGPLPVSGGIAVVTDPELPYSAPVTYAVLANNNPTASTVLNVTDPWLTHIGVPSRSMPLDIRAWPTQKRAAGRGVFAVLNRPNLVAITDGARRGPSSSVVVRTHTAAELAALNALLDDSQVLLLNVPATKPWGVPTSYISVDETTQDRYAFWGADPFRDWTLPYDVVDRPAGGSRAPVTWADVAAKYATWADIPAGTTWAQLAAGA